MYVYIYMYIYVYIYMYIYVYVYIYIYMYIYIYIYIYIYNLFAVELFAHIKHFGFYIKPSSEQCSFPVGWSCRIH